MGQAWRIELLGGLAAVQGERRITRFRTQRGALLLAMLAARPGRILPRDELGERLWPDEDPGRQRLRLRGELTELRATLGEDLFERQGNVGVALRADVASDVAEFEARRLTAARAAVPERRVPELQAAAALYRGDLLPGFYDDWSLTERERLRDAHADLSVQLIADLEVLGRSEEARVVRRETEARYPDRELPAVAAAPPGSRYFGRDADRAALAEWARRGAARLTTLVGPGGIGKTRLARVALPDALFLSLAALTHGAEIPVAIGQALNLPASEMPVGEHVHAHLRRHPRLLLLDNVDPLVDAGATAVIARLLEACPAVRIVVTSRRPLRLPDERVQHIGPLERAAAVDLFLDRARRARPDFGSGAEVVASVGNLVDLLEGLPLAIEIAAARMVNLSLRQIQAQLERRLPFLVNRHYADDERHRSLRAALDWSWNLLEPDLQRTFARLSVFRGGWSLESARIVCERDDTADALDALQAHSLATVAFDAADTPRYDLLAVVREYAAERLAESGDEARARERHAEALARIGDRVVAAVRSGEVPGAQTLLGQEVENLRQSIPWAIRNERYDLLYRWLDTMGDGLFERGRWEVFAALMDAVDGHITDQRALMRLCSLRGALLRRQGKEDSAALYWDRWLGVAESLNDAAMAKRALTQLTLQCLDRSDPSGALAYARRLERYDNDPVTVATIRCRLCLLQGDFPGARRWARTVLAKAAEDPAGLQAPLLYVIEALVQLGEFRTALHWIAAMFPLSDSTASAYHAVRLLDLAATPLETLGRVREACYALVLAERRHEELGSRFLKGARAARAQFQARHPEAESWARTPHPAMWDAVLAAVADPVYVLSTPAP